MDHSDFSLVIVTDYDQFIIKTFRFNALDYLLKKIDGKDLTKALEKSVLQRPDPKQIMSNDESIPVARNKKERLIEKFGWL